MEVVGDLRTRSWCCPLFLLARLSYRQQRPPADLAVLPDRHHVGMDVFEQPVDVLAVDRLQVGPARRAHPTAMRLIGPHGHVSKPPCGPPVPTSFAWMVVTGFGKHSVILLLSS